MQLTIDRGQIRVPLLFQDVVDERQRFGLRIETRQTADIFVAHRDDAPGFTRCCVPDGLEAIESRQLLRFLQTFNQRTRQQAAIALRSEEHTSELQSLMRISYAVFCLKKKKRSN